MNYLEVDPILRIHRRLTERTGDASGVLNPDAVDSAAAQARTSFGGQDLYPTLAAKAAALAHSPRMNHPFQDGNKRTAHAAMEMLLMRNGFEIDDAVDEQEAVLLGVAAGDTAMEPFTKWMAANMMRRT